MVRRLVEDQDVGVARHEDREREPAPLAAAQPVERLLGVLAAEQEAAEQATAPGSGDRPVCFCAASSTVRAPPHSSSSACWLR